MKALICLINYAEEGWIFHTLCNNYPAIKKIKSIIWIEKKILKKILPALIALLRFGFHRLNYKKILAHDLKIIEVFDKLPASSKIIDPVYKNWLLKPIQHRFKYGKLYYAFFYYYFLWKMRKFDILFLYNGTPSLHQCLIAAARKLKKKIIFFEVGPFLNTITLDNMGINYENSLPRNISFYHAWAEQNPDKTKMPEIEVRNKRFNFEIEDIRNLNQKYIFMPLQVFSDTQMLFGDWISNMQELVTLIHQVSVYLPDGYCILTKEHPRCYQRYNIREMETEKFLFANGNTTPDLIKNAQLILTLNSSVGLEAMLFEKPIITLGHAFYAFDNLTHRCKDKEALIQAIKNPKSISFNPQDRKVFLKYLVNAYYLEGNVHTRTIHVNQRNRAMLTKLIETR